MSTSNLRSGSVRSLDGILISVYLSLMFIGWLMVTAVAFSDSGQESFNLSNALLSQNTMWYAIAIVAFLSMLLLDYKFWNSTAWLWYSAGMFLLLLVVLVGKEVKGATSWFQVAGLSFQPSELAKLVTIVNLAGYLGLASVKINNTRSIFIALGIVFFPSCLIMLQPDAGSALIFSSLLVVLYRAGLYPIIYVILFTLIGAVIGTLMTSITEIAPFVMFLGMMLLTLQYRSTLMYQAIIAILILLTIALFNFVDHLYIIGAISLMYIGFSVYTAIRNRLQPVVVIGVFVVGVLGACFLANYGYRTILKPHQQDRINVWLHPDKCDPQGSLYNVIQSKTAIGSGGVFGKGFLQGNMTKLNYVPEQSTDFIFSTLGEEQGFVGVVGVMILFFILLARITTIAERAKNDFVLYYGYGLAAILFFQVCVNIGMTMGVMPVIGIPLPFISKGGTALVMYSLMVGMLVKMDLDRNKR